MTVEILHIVPRSPAWLALRRPLLTASDVPAAAALDPFKSPFELYAEKLGEKPPQADNASMKRGRLFEGAGFEYVREELPRCRIVRPNVFLRDRDLRLGATPDALLEDPDDPGLVNVQIKVVNRDSFDRWEGRAPVGYQVQVACENMLLDARRGILAVLVVSTHDADLHLFDIPRHARAEQRIRQVAAEFWHNVATGRRPAPDYERDAETIAAMFPRQAPGKVLDLGGDNRLAQILPRRELLKDRMGADKQELDALDAEIKLKLGDAEIAELPGWRISWKEEQRKGYTVAPSTRRPLHVKQIEIEDKAA